MEAVRVTTDNEDVVDLRNRSPRSKEVLRTVFAITNELLQGQRDLDKTQIIRTVSVILQAQGELTSPFLTAAPPASQTTLFPPQQPLMTGPQGFPMARGMSSPYPVALTAAQGPQHVPAVIQHGGFQTFPIQPIVAPTAAPHVLPTAHLQFPLQWGTFEQMQGNQVSCVLDLFDG